MAMRVLGAAAPGAAKVRAIRSSSRQIFAPSASLQHRALRNGASALLRQSAADLGLARPLFHLKQRAVSHVVHAAAVEEETFQYQAEVDRLLDMIVNSLYSNREVFLRELISNASDALDKARFLSLTDQAIMKGREELEIKISADKDKKQIIIEDSGVGMTKEQLLSNLGTIARSGTRKFMEAMNQAKGDSNLIGQFGVGFYSAFLVADRVTVVTKSAEEAEQWAWTSTVGSHQFTIKQDDGEPLIRGTRVILHLKEDAEELADPVRLARLIKQYSQFISFPIKLYSSKKEPKKVVDEEATQKRQEEADKIAEEKGEEKQPVEPVMKTEYVDVFDWRVENENKPIWTRNPKDVSQESYNDFFKQTFGEFLDPLAHIHFNVEGTVEFSGLLYIPGMAPMDQMQQLSANSKCIKLYVKRVFISDEFSEQLMPRSLQFIRGVVDSSDLPLNVSREILQESRVLRMIRKQLVRRSFEMMDNLAANKEDYKTFWENFGKYLKVATIEEQDLRDKLGPLLRFHSSGCKEEDELTGLEEYVSRMKEGQKAIYYIACDNLEAARSAPFVEKLMKKGYEVLYLVEPVDEAVLVNLATFKEKQFVDVTKEGLDLDDEEETKKLEEQEKALKPVTEFLKKTLGERIEKAVVSNRLATSPAALVTSKFGWSANMQRVMKNSGMGDPRAAEYMSGRKIMEVNPENDIVKGIAELLEEKDEERAADIAELLYETCMLTSGFTLESPREYADKVYLLMRAVLGFDVGGEEEQQAPAAAAEKPSEGAKKVPVVEPEVLSNDDVWRQ